MWCAIYLWQSRPHQLDKFDWFLMIISLRMYFQWIGFLTSSLLPSCSIFLRLNYCSQSQEYTDTALKLATYLNKNRYVVHKVLVLGPVELSVSLHYWCFFLRLISLRYVCSPLVSHESQACWGIAILNEHCHPSSSERAAYHDGFIPDHCIGFTVALPLRCQCNAFIHPFVGTSFTYFHLAFIHFFHHSASGITGRTLLSDPFLRNLHLKSTADSFTKQSWRVCKGEPKLNALKILES